MATAPTLSWQTYTYSLTANEGCSGQHTFKFDAPIRSYAIGISGFNFQVSIHQDLLPAVELQNFGISTSVLAIDGNTITVEITNDFLGVDNLNIEGWTKITVLAWIDNSSGYPPVLLANRKGIEDGQAAVLPIRIPMKGKTPMFALGKDKFLSVLSGFQLSLGTPNQENDGQTVIYANAGAGIVTNEDTVNLSAKSKIRGIGKTTVYRTTVNSDHQSIEANKDYNINTVKSGTVDAACCILSKDLQGFEVAPVSYVIKGEFKDNKARARPKNTTNISPFGNKKIKRSVFLLQSFTLGHEANTFDHLITMRSRYLSMMSIDFNQNPKNPAQYNAYSSVSYFDRFAGSKLNDPQFFYGFSNINGIVIAEV